MPLSRSEKLAMVTNPRYPRSAKYDPQWIFDNQMGSQCLWLLEGLSEVMDLKPGMRILDLGAGKAIGSIFLAKEFGCQVWATCVWVPPTENLARIKEAGVGDSVFPLHAEAHALPFAEGFFDAVIAVNALQFFGTSEYYLQNHLAKLVKPGGQLGIVVPGVYKEFEDSVPDYLEPLWQGEFYSWHSPEWWSRHWRRSGLVDVELADTYPDDEGATMFSRWGTVMGGEEGLCAVDKGRNVTFVRMVARRRG